jgi:hypothetical protein
MLLFEWPHQRVETVEQRFLFMHGCIIDLGFENIGISKMYVQLAGGGLKIPGIDYMMFLDRSANLRITRGGNDLPNLPFNWFSATYGVKGNNYVWIGPNVRQDQISGIDKETYENAVRNFEKYEQASYGYEEVQF